MLGSAQAAHRTELSTNSEESDRAGGAVMIGGYPHIPALLTSDLDILDIRFVQFVRSVKVKCGRSGDPDAARVVSQHGGTGDALHAALLAGQR